MGLIESNEVTELTKEQKLDITEKRVRRQCKSMFAQIKNNHLLLWDLIWNNDQGLSPQEVLDKMGTDAAELFELSDSIQQLASSACMDYVAKVTPNEYTLNEDGTVTLGAERV